MLCGVGSGRLRDAAHLWRQTNFLKGRHDGVCVAKKDVRASGTPAHTVTVS